MTEAAAIDRNVCGAAQAEGVKLHCTQDQVHSGPEAGKKPAGYSASVTEMVDRSMA